MEGKYLEAYNEESELTQPKPLQKSYVEVRINLFIPAEYKSCPYCNIKC